MANLKEIRNRISSVSSTMQITSAMKMVSAAKLKRATDTIVSLRPYAEKMQEILSNVSSSLDSSEGIYSQVRDEKNVLVLAISSNRGLCGGFNNFIMKEVSKVIRDHDHANVKVMGLGKKVYESFMKTDHHTTLGMEGLPYEIFDDLTYENNAAIAQLAMDAFTEGEIDKVVVVYNKFKNAAVQIPTVEQMLPVLPLETKDSTGAIQYEYEPSKETIVNDIIPNSLKTQLFKALLDSHASEHGARMTAMHKATENATELRDELKLHYNKARQAAITNEILEIVGGAEALNN